MPGTVLYVDDEMRRREHDLASRLAERGYTVIPVTMYQELADSLNNAIDVALVDVRIPGPGSGDIHYGWEIQKHIAAEHPDVVVIMFSAYAKEPSDVVRAMRQGAYDFLSWPWEYDDLCFALERAITHGRTLQKCKTLSAQLAANKGLSALIGASEGMNLLRTTIQNLARSDFSVLVQGESGVGKELVASAIHTVSSRSEAPFLVVNAATMHGDLLESELFGHEKGAFTGATSTRRGQFELAAGGSVFLDEVGTMEPRTQAKILRIIENKSFRRVGGSQELTCSVRVIAATNDNLAELVDQGVFRQDLYFRLNALPIHVPALRDRREDIELLAAHFLMEANDRHGSNKQFSQSCLEAMRKYNWPGNVRELRNVVERLVVSTRDEAIDISHLPFAQDEDAQMIRAWAGQTFKSAVAAFESMLISDALKKCHGNKTRAAEMLGLPRRTFFHKLRTYGGEPR